MADVLAVSPDPLLVEPNTSEGEVTVHYIFDHPGLKPFIWERIGGDPWAKVDVHSSRVTSPGDPEKEGLFRQILRLGETYQVVMYHLDSESADPNVTSDVPIEPVARCSTSALRKEPPSSILGEMDPPKVGGTWCSWSPAVNRPTMATLEISKDPPATDSDGFMRFNSRIGKDHSFGFSQSPSLEIASESLLPGNPYFVLLLVVDQSGAWEQRLVPVTTRQRRVEIRFEEIWVINDGSAGHNTASFKVWVIEGPKIAAAGSVPEREITDRPSPGEEFMEHIPLQPFIAVPIVLGPRIILDGPDPHTANRKVAVVTRGIASVTAGTDDISGNFLPGPVSQEFPDEFSGTIFTGAYLDFPIGSDDEKVTNRPFSVTAVPLTGDNEFEYAVKGNYSVTYP